LSTLLNYRVEHPLGQGTFAKVYEVEEIDTNTHWAVKIIPKSSVTAATQTEIDLVARFDHPSLVKVHEMLNDDEFHYLVTELLTNGTLLQQLNHKQTFTEHEGRHIFKDIFEGVRYLHEKHEVAHLDLKLENIMIDDMSRARIIDFGLTRPFTMFKNTRLKCGSHPYCSPEMLSGQHVTEQTDIWSLGILLYTLVIGDYPFSASDVSLLTSRILFDDVTFPIPVSEDIRDLIEKMLEKNASKRITLSEISSHAWMVCPDRSDPSAVPFHLPRLPFLFHPSLPSVSHLPKARRTQGSNLQQSGPHRRILTIASRSSRLSAAGARLLNR
jgi:serine/threonine protein kinase